jgi:hypothetical protein
MNVEQNNQRVCGKENHYFVYPKTSNLSFIFCRYCGQTRHLTTEMQSYHHGVKGNK